MGPLEVDTPVQQAVANEIGDIATAQKATIESFLSEVQALQARFMGEAGTATQMKANQLHEVGIALMAEFDSISERVHQASGGTVTADTDGASIISSSAGVAF